MKKTPWTKYFQLKEGYSSRFRCVGLNAVIDLNDENVSLETLKKLYDLGVANIGLTEDGEKKYFPGRVVKTTSIPEKQSSGPKRSKKP